MPLDTLQNTLTHELSDLLSAEQQFAKALTTVAKNADSDVVKQMAAEHREETLAQIENLKQAFSLLGARPEKGMVCKGAQGIVEENSSTLKEEKPKGALKDIALVSGSLRIEHYEIAGYTAAISLAKSLGEKDVVKLLQSNLKQEKETAKKLESASPELLAAARADEAPEDEEEMAAPAATRGKAKAKTTRGKTA